MNAPKTVQSGGETTRDAPRGKWTSGTWCYGQGQITRIEPGDRLTLRATFEPRKNSGPPASVEFKIYPEVSKRRNLPEPLFTVTGEVGEGGAKADWQVPMDHEDWPANLMFIPVAEGFSEDRGWTTPLVTLADAWDVDTFWSPGRAEPGAPVTLNAVIHGLKAGDEVTFKVGYKDDTRTVDLQPEDESKGYPPPEVKATLATIEEGEHAGELKASAPWTIPNPDQLGELAGEAAQTPADDGEVPAPQGAFQLPRPRHTLVLKWTAGPEANPLSGRAEISIEEPPFILSL